MSGFDTYLRNLLVRRKRTRERAGEWDQAIKEARSELGQLGRLGGDPNFAVFVLANYKWRWIKPPTGFRDRDQLVACINRLLKLLEADGWWQRYLDTSGGSGWLAVKPGLKVGRDLLKAVHNLDESVFEAVGTRRGAEQASWRSQNVYNCLAVLDWHIRNASGRTRSNRILLAGLLRAFGMLSSRSEEQELWIEKRLQRLQRRRGYAEKFVIPRLVMAYHETHRMASVVCGSACQPFKGTFEMVENEEEKLGRILGKWSK